MQALFVSFAGLFDHHIEITDRAHNPDRFADRPALVCVGIGVLARLQHGHGGSNRFRVVHGVVADLDLELPITRSTMGGQLLANLIDGFVRHHPIHGRAIGQPATQQHPHRLTNRLAENVPEGIVEWCLGIVVSLDGVVHQTFEFVDLARVLSNQDGGEQTRGSFGSLGMGGHIVVAAGTVFTDPADAHVGVDDHDGRACPGDRIAPAPAITSVDVGQVFLVEADTTDSHGLQSAGGMRTMLPTNVLARNACCAA